jgi:hypothetical protein
LSNTNEIPFVDWLREAAPDEVRLSPTNLNDEARTNMWSFSITEEQACACSADDFVEFIRAIVEARRASLSARRVPSRSVTFYCWHDQLAAQLRFSLISATNMKLPFGCETVIVQNLEQIVAGFLSSSWHDGISRTEFETVSASDNEEAERSIQPLAVWTAVVP